MATIHNTASGCAHVKTKSYGAIHRVSPGTAMCKVKIGPPIAGIKNPKNLTSPAPIDDSDDGLPTIECIHPNKNPHSGPNPRRKYAYSPPASGIIAPNSANARAPNSDNTAPTIHAANTIETKRPSRAI